MESSLLGVLTADISVKDTWILKIIFIPQTDMLRYQLIFRHFSYSILILLKTEPSQNGLE